MFSAAACFGCGGKTAPKVDVHPVSGVVTMKGKPVAGASLYFIPAAVDAGAGGSATTAADGRYTAKYSDGRDGLPAGEYIVSIEKYVAEGGKDLPADANLTETDLMAFGAKQIIPPKYGGKGSSTLRTVVEPAKTAYDFEVGS